MIGLHAQTTSGEEDKPVMTIGCLSDLHNELGLISGDLSTVRLRGTVGNTVKRMREEEDVDLVCLGGDYTSDVTISKENWERVKQLMRETTRMAFQDYRTHKPVIYVTGNHDYEVANFDSIPKGYNAGYYQDIMEEDIGVLEDTEAYYEEADNDTLGKEKLLAAYHYQIGGFDFVMLNCGLHFFKDAWDYTYSVGSVQWVANKLAELYSDDPNKTVFFLLHIPFSDSNSLSASNKGMSNSEGTRLLKATLEKYPYLIMLYGHDHGTDSAYIRTKTSQRVTRYDNGGMVISSYDETHVDAPVSPDEPEEESTLKANIKSQTTGKYLSYSTSTNLTTQETPMEASINKVDDATEQFAIKVGGSYVYCGSSATFSGNSQVSNYSKAFIYKVSDNKGTRISTTAALADGSQVVLIYKASKDNNYYALLPEDTKSSPSSDNRMKAQLISTTEPTAEISVDNNDMVWLIEQSQPSETSLPLSACIQNVATGKYIGEDTNNLNTVDEASPCTIYEEGGNLYVSMPNNNRHLHIGSGGRFSRGDATALKFFEITTPTDGGDHVGQLVDCPKMGVPYAIAGEKSGKTYLLTNKVYNAGKGDDQRLEGQEVTITDSTITVSAGNEGVIWKLTTRPAGDPSFFSSFMGSMRYYNNSIEGDVSVSNSKIVQALMVYIYPNRITLKMKNYGESGTFNGIRINKDLAAYTVYRDVRNANGSLTAIKGVTTERNTRKADGHIYDLMGRQVKRPTHGVYITGGRKIVL